MPKGRVSNRHAEEQPRCEASKTLEGRHCENPGTQGFEDGFGGALLLCERHARRFRLAGWIACWEAIIAHIDLWSRVAHRWGRVEVAWLLRIQRAEAAAALKCAYEELKRAED